MEIKKLFECVDFFKKLNIVEDNVTTNEERENGQLVVTVQYRFEKEIYQTKKLYYKNISGLGNIKNEELVIQYFEEPVYWLDIEKHGWPKGSGESDLEEIVINDIAADNDDAFKSFLKTLAKNDQSGYIQKITEDGRSGQYYHNLENNNHWHDLIILIKAIIESGGKEIGKRYFSRLIFKWDGDKNTDRYRSTLTNKAYPCTRSLIDCLYKNVKSIQMDLKQTDLISLLLFKKQIILQGPPGTGKTRMAKEVARNLCLPLSISIEQIKQIIVPNLVVRSAKDYVDYKIIGSDDAVIKIQNEAGVTSNSSYTDIIQSYTNKSWLTGVILNGSQSYSAAIAKYVYEQIEDENIKLIQFHPAYSYEDFVRGITAKTDGTNVEYKTENKTLAHFADTANENFKDSLKDNETFVRDKWINEKFEEFRQEVVDELAETQQISLTNKLSLVAAEDSSFRIKSESWAGDNLKYSEIKKLFKYNVQNKNEIKNHPDILRTVYHRTSYYFPVLNRFKNFLREQMPPVGSEKGKILKNFVLVIDEINRANLPSVLGELIYALEYRGQTVQSMYEMDGDRSLVLPPNLYIIGTMNTADRSVGHIDYAIRRRFAFVDILPTKEPIHPIAAELFKKVSELFIKNYDAIDWNNPLLERSDYLAPDFRPEDVWVGHSYFISAKKNIDEAKSELQLKLDYEIKPLLKEYLKDGLLLASAEDKIKTLHV